MDATAIRFFNGQRCASSKAADSQRQGSASENLKGTIGGKAGCD
jgi:hypothetical protein